MKSNRLALTLTEDPRTNASAVEIASSLLHSFEQFGIVRDAAFAKRSSVIAFTNAVVLAKGKPDETARLFAIVAPSEIGRDLIRTAAGALASVVSDDDAWVGNLRECLSLHWSQSCGANKADAVRQETIFGLAVGLEVAASHAELAELIFKRTCQLGDENRFLAARLVNWTGNGFRPRVAPFIEFLAGLYLNQPIERDVICPEAEEALACAQLLPDPWRLAFWVEQAWTRGRRFSQKQPGVLRQMLIEAPQANREFTLKLYRELVLNAADANGRVDIERATLAFFGRSEGGRCAVEYCTGDQPRKLARLAFDFAFWIGILSAIPLPEQCLAPLPFAPNA